MYSIKKKSLSKISQLIKHKNIKIKIILTLSIISLAGLPPFSGFLAKFIIINRVLESDYSFILFPIVIGTLIRLFFYLQITFSSMFLSINMVNFKKKANKTQKSKIVVINLIGLFSGYLFFLFLDFKLYKLKAFKALKKDTLRSRLLNLKLYKLKAFQASKKEILRFKLSNDDYFQPITKISELYILF